jgi:hypothetical protein
MLPEHEVSTTCVSGWMKRSIKWVGCAAHPLTQVVLTSLRGRATN